MQPNDENYQTLKLDLKAKQHYVIGKEYALKFLRNKIEYALANPEKSLLRKLYDNFLVGSEMTPSSNAIFLQLSTQELECRHELVEGTSIKFFPPPIPSRRPYLKNLKL